MRYLWKALPWVIVGLLLTASVASAASNPGALDGLIQTLGFMLQAFVAYLEAIP